MYPINTGKLSVISGTPLKHFYLGIGCGFSTIDGVCFNPLVLIWILKKYFTHSNGTIVLW
jgi:hypothetical protein